MNISVDNEESGPQWVDRFLRNRGRPPRVLHIGNMANNAYLNAKILNRVGLENHVLCYDYYHIMACPEWEEVDFDGRCRDEQWAKYWPYQTGFYRQPSWFAQGPLAWCVWYLLNHAGNHLMSPLKHFLTEIAAVVDCYHHYFREQIPRRFPDYWRWIKTGRDRLLDRSFLGYPRSARSTPEAPTAIAPEEGLAASPPEMAAELVKAFDQAFPERPDRLKIDDTAWPFHPVELRRLRELFRMYDLVIGYSIDPIMALLIGVWPYAAYEHGTIRSFPFEDSAIGRLTALSYRLADQCFITNADNITAAEKLGLTNYCFIPHPVNEEVQPGREEECLRESLRRRLDSDFIGFHPARQHWDEKRHPSWEKGNDVFIRGLARFIHEVNPRASAVFVEWGQTVAESKSLLSALGINERVLWIPPQPNVRMIRYIRACDVLADQFFLGAFGSTLPKALLHGRPGMVYLDEESHRWCFPEMPPVINARTDDDVFQGLRRLYLEPEFKEDIIRRGRVWYDRYHSNEVIAETFLQAFQALIK